MEVGAAARATALEPYASSMTARTGSIDHLPEPRHVDVAGTVLRNAPSSGRSAGLLRRTRRRLLGTILIVILVSAEALLSVTHGCPQSRRDCMRAPSRSELRPGRRGSSDALAQLAPFFTAWYVASHVASEAGHERVKAPRSRDFRLLTAKQV